MTKDSGHLERTKDMGQEECLEVTENRSFLDAPGRSTTNRQGYKGSFLLKIHRTRGPWHSQAWAGSRLQDTGQVGERLRIATKGTEVFICASTLPMILDTGFLLQKKQFLENTFENQCRQLDSDKELKLTRA